MSRSTVTREWQTAPVVAQYRYMTRGPGSERAAMNAPSWERIKEVFQDALDRPPHDRASWLARGAATIARCRRRSSRCWPRTSKPAALPTNHRSTSSTCSPPRPRLHRGQPRAARRRPARRLRNSIAARRREGWARSTRRSIPGSNASSPSRCCLRISPRIAIATERFTREARAIASLDHAHICSLYDGGRARRSCTSSSCSSSRVKPGGASRERGAAARTGAALCHRNRRRPRPRPSPRHRPSRSQAPATSS